MNGFRFDTKGQGGFQGFVRRMCFKHPDKVFVALQAIMVTQVTIEARYLRVCRRSCGSISCRE